MTWQQKYERSSFCVELHLIQNEEKGTFLFNKIDAYLYLNCKVQERGEVWQQKPLLTQINTLHVQAKIFHVCKCDDGTLQSAKQQVGSKLFVRALLKLQKTWKWTSLGRALTGVKKKPTTNHHCFPPSIHHYTLQCSPPYNLHPS